MALGVDAISHGPATVDVQTKTWAHACGAGANKLVIFPGAGSSTLGDRTVTSVTYNGVGCVSMGTPGDDGNFMRSSAYKMDNPPTGLSLNIVVTYGGSVGVQSAAGAISFNDAAATDGALATNTGTAANANVTVPDSANGDIVVSFLSTDVSTTPTTENGTLVFEDENVNSDTSYNCQRQVASGANTACSWSTTSTGEKWAAVGVAIKPLAAPPPPNPSGLDESGYFPSEPQTNTLVVSSW